MSNALHTNAEIVKEHYLHEINTMLQSALAANIQQQVDQAGGTFKDSEVPQMVTRVTFQCENFGGSPLTPSEYRAVMTAWALGVPQKGQVIARFLVDLSVFRAELESHRERLVKDLDHLRLLTQIASVERIERAANEIVEVTAASKGRPQPPADAIVPRLSELDAARAAAVMQRDPSDVADSAERILDMKWVRRPSMRKEVGMRERPRVQATRVPRPEELDELEDTSAQVARALAEQRRGLQRIHI